MFWRSVLKVLTDHQAHYLTIDEIMSYFPSTVVQKTGAVQHRAEKVQSCQQESSGPVCQLLWAEGKANQAPGWAGPWLQIHHGAHECPGATQVWGHPAHFQTGKICSKAFSSLACKTLITFAGFAKSPIVAVRTGTLDFVVQNVKSSIRNIFKRRISIIIIYNFK